MAPDNQSPTEPMPEPALLALAREKFGALSGAEEELFRAAQEGRGAFPVTGDEKDDDPANAKNWDSDRVVRAKCISWVCTDPAASALVTHQGLDLNKMRIDGELDLRNAEIKFSLRVWKCAFSENIYLWDAQLAGFCLMSCQLKSLRAERATLDGAVFLRDCRAEGEVNLVGAKIEGDLDCGRAFFLKSVRVCPQRRRGASRGQRLTPRRFYGQRRSESVRRKNRQKPGLHRRASRQSKR